VPGFLLLSPVYANDVPTTTPAEREAALRGWVYASLRADLLLGPVVDSTERQIDLEVFEDDSPKVESLVFAADMNGHGNANQPVRRKIFAGALFTPCTLWHFMAARGICG